MKELLLSFLLMPFCFTTTSAAAFENPFAPLICYADSSSCALPEPAQVEITGVSTNYFEIEWTIVPNAYGYKVDAIESVSNIIVKTIITRDHTAKIDGLVSGTEYSIKVTATACEGGFKQW